MQGNLGVPGTATGSSPSPALPLEVRGGQLQTPGGPTALLTGLPGGLRVRQEEAGTLVLGMASSTGPAALADFPLGQVRRHRCSRRALRAAPLGVALPALRLLALSQSGQPAHLPTLSSSLPLHLPVQLRCRRFLALPKTSLYWMSPRFGATAAQVPVRSLLPSPPLPSPPLLLFLTTAAARGPAQQACFV